MVPTGALDLALWMESDRMGYLLPALTEQKFKNQRDVVLNERRQNYENRPYGLAGMALSAAMFPPDHPYHWLTIGSADDLRAASLDDVREFFQTYYHPGNASLALAGDIETERAFDLAEQYFGELAGGPGAGPVRVDARLPMTARQSRARRSRRAAAPLSRLALAGDVRATTTPSSISSPTCSPTARRRGSTRRWSTSGASRPMSSAYQHSREMSRHVPDRAHRSGRRGAAGAGGSDPRARCASWRRRARPPTNSSAALAQTEAQFIYRLQTIGGFGGKSDQLNAYNMFAGDPGYFDARSRSATRAVTAGQHGRGGAALARRQPRRCR